MDTSKEEIVNLRKQIRIYVLPMMEKNMETPEKR